MLLSAPLAVAIAIVVSAPRHRHLIQWTCFSTKSPIVVTLLHNLYIVTYTHSWAFFWTMICESIWEDERVAVWQGFEVTSMANVTVWQALHRLGLRCRGGGKGFGMRGAWLRGRSCACVIWRRHPCVVRHGWLVASQRHWSSLWFGACRFQCRKLCQSSRRTSGHLSFLHECLVKTDLVERYKSFYNAS